MNNYQRAMQLWSILAPAASRRTILTYGEVGDAVGVPAVAVGPLLGPVQDYCIANELPPLTALVVNQETGLPGIRFIAGGDLPREQMRVFRYNWLEHGAPSQEDY